MLNIPKWKLFSVIFVCLTGIFLTLPDLIDDKDHAIFPSWMQKVNLGLDLQGGSQILLKIDMDKGIKDNDGLFLFGRKYGKIGKDECI